MCLFPIPFSQEASLFHLLICLFIRFLCRLERQIATSLAGSPVSLFGGKWRNGFCRLPFLTFHLPASSTRKKIVVIFLCCCVSFSASVLSVAETGLLKKPQKRNKKGSYNKKNKNEPISRVFSLVLSPLPVVCLTTLPLTFYGAAPKQNARVRGRNKKVLSTTYKSREMEASLLMKQPEKMLML